MNNITNYSHRKFDFQLSNRKVYDFQLADVDTRDDNSNTINPVLGISFNVAGEFILDNNWDGKIIDDITIPTYGLTGIDNGAINYTSDLTLSSSHTITENWLKPVAGYNPEHNLTYLITQNIFNNQPNTVTLRGGFYQGFYRLEGYDYQTLPNRFQKGWTFNIKLQPYTPPVPLTNILNTHNEDTEGFFFYMGTRAENKFWNRFEGLNPETDTMKETTYEGVFELWGQNENVLEEDKEKFVIPLNPPRIVIKKVDNQFLIYGRSSGNTFCGAKTNFGFGTKVAEQFESGDSLIYSTHIPLDNINEINPFLKYGRSSGHTFCGGKSKDGYGTAVAEGDGSRFNLSDQLDPYKDIINNAIGFRIKDDGSLGYRRILDIDKNSKCLKIYDMGVEVEDFIFKYTKVFNPETILFEDDIIFHTMDGMQFFPEDENGFDIEELEDFMDVASYEAARFVVYEEYSQPGVIQTGEMTNITIKWVADKDLECEFDDARNGTVYVYKSGYLTHVFRDFEEIINQPLYEHVGKQVGVPFNISIGGGTQGLIESMTFDGPDPSDQNLPLGKYFGGTFIGDVERFKLFDFPLSWCDIKSVLI